ncbi:MAG: serine acetyltransferase [Epulopiscium sp. Nele67-Bin005]|nr:MAG: serine acetyltransferase [Epulopiscium sp. Nele67-Bin005]
MKKKLVLVGGGGHAKSVIDTIKSGEEYDIIGIVDMPENIGKTIEGIKIIGTDENLSTYYKEETRYAFISLGSIGNPQSRIRIYNFIKNMGFEIPNIIDRTAILGENIIMGEGCFVGKGAIINTSVKIGNNVIVNTGVVVEHDCSINNFVHIAPSTTLCGGVKIGENSHIGAGTTIIQNISVGKNCIIGAGSVVLSDVEKNYLAYGVPAMRKTKL